MLKIIADFFQSDAGITVNFIICGFSCAILGFIGGYILRATKDLPKDD